LTITSPGPRTVTISAVDVPGGDQPVSVDLAEYPGRPFKPNKSMRRVLAKAWGAESAVWVGRRLTLFGNPAVIYGGKAVGGIEIAAMSHIDKPLTMPLTAKRGQKKSFTVQTLAAAAPTRPTRDWLTEAKAAPDTDALRAIWIDAKAAGADDDTLKAIQNAKEIA